MKSLTDEGAPSGVDTPSSPRSASSSVCENPHGYQLPRFDAHFGYLLLGFFCLWIASLSILTRDSLIVLAVVELTYLFGCSRSKRALLALIPSFLLPFGWLLLVSHPWDDYRWLWLGSWLALPGVALALPWRLNSDSTLLLSSLVSCVLILGAVTLGRIGQSWLYVASVGALVVSCVSSYLAYCLFVA